ncbi:cytochrome P450 6A1 [Xylariomycetidae sp. FL0641]|nr:cytochrome P450 6A1 [Xylariomycetidae sp. FL0641]
MDGDIMDPSFSHPSSWPRGSLWVLLLVAAATFFVQVLRRPPFPANAPRLHKVGDWPVLGALSFYGRRADWFQDAARQSPTGNFSFYVGKKQIVGLSGVEGRRFFFENRELNFSAGFAELLTGQPARPATETDNFTQWFAKTLLALLKKENMNRVLPQLTSDVRGTLDRLSSSPSPSVADKEWRVMNPFDTLYLLIYQMTMRMMGTAEVAEDPALLKHTLEVFEWFEQAVGTTNVVFPWLPTPTAIMRRYYATRLAMVLGGVAKQRRKTGERRDDALQVLIDQGSSVRDILAFQIASLYAGQLNSGIAVTYLQTYLATHPDWLARVRHEVDTCIATHRSSSSQSPADVLDALPISAWETAFPTIDVCLRETLRLSLPGVSFRKNTSGHDLRIGGESGEIVPDGAFAAYLVDDTLLNPQWYTNPREFDPDRFSEGRSEDKKAPHAFMGWGSGRHPCLGMRFAKLELILITAYLVTMFDIQVSDKDGNLSTEPPPTTDRNAYSYKKPDKPVFLRYRERVYPSM